MVDKKQAMVSRSLRIDKETLGVLEEAARNQDIGITVYIRMILQSFAVNLRTDKVIKELEELELAGPVNV